MKQNPQRDIYSISRLNREVKTLLEGFPLLWIEGELSNFKSYGSGHWYFSLKDQASQVSCAMFRGKNMLTKIKPRDGMLVQVRAKVTLYEPRGNYQIIVEHMEEAGEGALRRAFDELKQKLSTEGLFDSQHKKIIPEHPKCVGVITSASGAAIHDIISTLKRRFPALPIILYPVAVQGDASKNEIVAAIKKAQQRKECDVLIVGRGGGSLEDLWSFNEENVARAIYNCTIPIISAVGHEVDFTIADFVSDHRAPTPTAAAELVSPDQRAYQQQLINSTKRLNQLITAHLKQQQQQLKGLSQRLIHPSRHLQDMAQRLDELQTRYIRAQKNRLNNDKIILQGLATRFALYDPAEQLQQQHNKYQLAYQRLQKCIQQRLKNKTQQLTYIGHSLDTVSPLATLQRGYAIVTQHDNDKIIRTSKKIKVGDKMVTQLSKGTLFSTVDKIKS